MMDVPRNFERSASADRLPYGRSERTSNNEPPRERSGILERYTYKTDDGELIPRLVSKIRVRSSQELCDGQRTRNVPSPCHPWRSRNPEFIHTIREKIRKKITYSTNKVQTEHCDSTTDLEIPRTPRSCSVGYPPCADDSTRNIFDSPDTESEDDKSSTTLGPGTIDDHSLYTLPPMPDFYASDSDSDCQIVEDNSEHIADNQIGKNAVRRAIDADIVHVISDSDSEDDLSLNRMCQKQYRNLSKNKKIDNKPIPTTPDTDVVKYRERKESVTDVHKPVSESESSVYEIFNGIKITLPSSHVNNNSLLLTHNLTENLSLKDATKSQIISILSRPSTSLERSLAQRPDTTTTFYKKTPPKSDMFLNCEMTPTKTVQKNDYQLSPESMKSEFYSYLKINTNPLAQKEETVAQNRRSNRVKNLIEQSEKMKEKIKKKNAHKKPEADESKKKKQNDVRLKYLKYSTKPLVFPHPPAQCKRIKNFQNIIEKYFSEENIRCTKNSHNTNSITDSKVLLKMDSHNFVSGSKFKTKLLEDRAMMLYRTKILKQINDKIDRTKARDKILKIKKKNLLKKKLKYKNLRLSTSRVLRNALRPVTRHAVKKPNTISKKLLKTQGKINMKCRSPKEKSNKSKSKEQIESILEDTSDKVTDTESVNGAESPDIQNDTKIESTHTNKKIQKMYNRVPLKVVQKEKLLSPLDKFEMITQTYLAEHPLEHHYSVEESSSSAVPITDTTTSDTNSTIMSVQSEELEMSVPKNTVTNPEIIEAKRKLNNSPHCIGFVPDDKIIKIREGLKKILNLQLNKAQNNIVNESVTKPSVSDEPDLSKNDNISVAHQTLNALLTDIPREETSKTVNTDKPNQTDSDQFISDKPLKNPNYIPLNPNVKLKSFHRSLLTANSKRKLFETPPKATISFPTNSSFNFEYLDSEPLSPKTAKSPNKRHTHEIDIDKSNGPVFNAYYVNYTLIIVQEWLISFWKQTPLGNILGAQNMWLSIGNIQRITLERGCTNRRSSEMIFSLENSIAYVELWTKEHKSAFRERPIADVFATIYYHKGHGTPDKKVLQLENIKGYSNDVRFAVIKNSREIIVSWCDTFSKPIKTVVRSYELASDFQTISSVKEMESVAHYVSSLHNIGDCDTLVLGAGNENIFVWNLAHGWLVSTVSLTEINVQSPMQTHAICLWAHCDNGFLFLLQQIGIGILRLVAVNGMTNEWKQLQTYRVPSCYLNLLGVTVESGILMTCYTNGFLCWDMQSGQLLADTETPSDQIVLPSNKYMVSIDNFQVTVKHVMAYLLTND